MPIPNGLVECPVCGDYNGSVRAADLAHNELELPRDPGRILTVSCLCKGIPCLNCKINLINRPGSNSYNPESNTVEHWPYFSGMRPCAICRNASHLH